MNADLFWSKVEKTESCWNWIGRMCPKGYGYFDLRNGKAEKWKERAHRLSWKLLRGEIPEGLHVLHKCDNRRCVNPEHLFLGTHLENMQDMVAKGRHVSVHVYGEGQGAAVLTDTQVREIRQLAGKMSQKKIGEMYNVSQSNVSRIVTRASWPHI